MYASDNDGTYPRSLAALFPGNYLKSIPTCSAAEKDTYSESYFSRGTGKKATFRFHCAGKNHAKAYSGFKEDSTDFPRYDSHRGLIDHPGPLK